MWCEKVELNGPIPFGTSCRGERTSTRKQSCKGLKGSIFSLPTELQYLCYYPFLLLPLSKSWIQEDGMFMSVFSPVPSSLLGLLHELAEVTSNQ